MKAMETLKKSMKAVKAKKNSDKAMKPTKAMKAAKKTRKEQLQFSPELQLYYCGHERRAAAALVPAASLDARDEAMARQRDLILRMTTKKLQAHLDYLAVPAKAA
eukprot:Skav234414  [mRNA]  locus=scaffold3157:146513:147798:- [translate_table: standard]